MTWVGTFTNSSDELFNGGLEGYFTLSVGTGGGIPSQVDNTTNADVSFGTLNFLGRINFFGNNLTVGTTQLPNGTSMPVLTGGTITSITFEYNYALAQVIEFGGDPTPFFDAQFLEASAVIQLPNISAAALAAAITQSYTSGSAQPFIDFVSQQTVHFTGTSGVNFLSGSNGNDILRGLAGNDVLYGGGGDDFLDAGSGTDVMDGGEGSDLYLPGPGALSGSIGDGVSDSGQTAGDIDTISYANATAGLIIDLYFQDGSQSTGWAQGLQASGIERVIGSDFDDIIVGTDFPESIQDTAADILIGGKGDDVLYGLAGSDTLEGGAGFDTLVGGANGDIANPGPGDTARFNVAKNDLFLFFQQDGSVFVATPGGGVDTLFEMEFIKATNGTFALSSFANSSSNLMIGTDGQNNLSGTSGKDLIFGKSGNDIITGMAGRDILEGGNGKDTIDGGGGNDKIFGDFGDDTLKGGGGKDTLKGDSGKDSLRGGGGDDTLFGGDDADDLKGENGNDNMFGGSGDDVAKGGAGNDTIKGGSGKDKIFGNGGSDTLDGQSGNDRVFGNNGDDTLKGSGGDDRLFGGAGKDTMNGGSGKDHLTGGTGRDIQTGGGGADRFIYNDKAETGITASTRDVIKDFSRSQNDMIDLSGIDAKQGPGNQAFTFINKSAFSSTAGELRYVKVNGTTLIRGDTDGDGAKDFEIALTGLFNLKADDFIL